ncbi:MBL fold metallo-hydrolase [Olsenella profusa]|uniref:MBL fold metallo-hydrolase n=1 Tax=Olsenella profusa TaxID=138595 RepID=A0ABS2F251_9ACTN|nr:MBL fold metallo-hydrolase [Olsenella profusa]MBM6774898.1 MBL fold metallo-hydrolase [Olsenella profusa]
MASGLPATPAGEGWGAGCGANCFTLDEDGFTCRQVLDEPEVWRVELLMGDTFLPSVNAFVVVDGGEALVVDAGTPDPLNDTRLMRALLGLGVDPATTPVTLFCTHAHIDHVGLARELAEAGVRVLVPEGVAADMCRFTTVAWRAEMASRLAAEGFGEAEAAELADVIWDHTLDFAREGIPFSTVAPGEEVRCGRWSFEVCAASGHTPGQCVLWEGSTHTAFLGDAVLFLCSTCIGFWDEGEDPIGEQVATLRRLARRGVEHAFMGHGLQRGTLAERCEENAAHHERRSARALDAVALGPGRTGRELMPAMGWRALDGGWDELPALTRWFLASESVAHLDHLVAVGSVHRTRDADGVSRYLLA